MAEAQSWSSGEMPCTLANLLLLFSEVGASPETMTKFRLGPVTARQALGTEAGWGKPESQFVTLGLSVSVGCRAAPTSGRK